MEKHHVFPQQFRTEFLSRGIDIDNYAIKITKSDHNILHNAEQWNLQWANYLKANPKATKSQLIDQMETTLGKSGFLGRVEFVRYSAPAQKTGEIIVKHPVWILQFAGKIGETFIKWFGGTNIGNIAIAFLAPVGSAVLGFFGIKAEQPILVGVGFLIVIMGLLLSLCILYILFLIYSWMLAVVIPAICVFFYQLSET